VTFTALSLPPAKLPSKLSSSGPVLPVVASRFHHIAAAEGKIANLVFREHCSTEDDDVAMSVSAAMLTSTACATAPTCNVS